MENANLGGAILFRNKTELTKDKILNKPLVDPSGKSVADSASLRSDEPVSIDLYKAMKYKNSKHDIILQDKDLVYIPEVNPFVTVQGRVQSPIKITFDREHTNLGYYIDKAGGYGIRPWRKRVFVTYANGRSRRTKNLFFAHFYPRIEEGSTITIPERPEGKELTNIVTQTITTAIPLLVAFLILKIK